MWLGFFLSFQTFRIFCRNIWHGSQNSIYVSRVKIAEKTVFFCFLSRTFSNFEQKLFRLSAKKLQKVLKTTYVSRGKVCDLVFFKLSNVSDFLQKQLAWFSKFYLRVQSKNCGKNSFFFVFFPEIFRILSKNFSDFWPKNFKKISKLPTCPEEKFVTWKFFIKFWIVLDFLQKHLAWFSKFYLRVQSKNCGKNRFFLFSFQNFFEFWAKIFQTFSRKTSGSCQNYLLRVQRNTLWL